ncbi:MAG: hypothetical protein KJ052_02915 [Candidatus Hydrogenedentes bacterium]|nr:hypothetical protein [Candidatus Hydrogenedentota bacterium]
MKKLINHTGPYSRVRAGRFEVSLWQWIKVISAPEDQRDYKPDREYIVRRAKIRYSRYNRYSKTWDEQAIWCNINDLEDFKKAIEQLEGSGGD